MKGKFIQQTNSFNILSKICNLILNSRMWGKLFRMPSGMFHLPKLQLRRALFMPYFTLYALFHIFICFSYFVGPFFKLKVCLYNISLIFPMNDEFFHSLNNSFNFWWQSIHSKNVNFLPGKRNLDSKHHSFKIILFVQSNFSFFLEIVSSLQLNGKHFRE